MATYTVKAGGKVYTYDYERGKYDYNTKEYNRKYWLENKVRIKRKLKLKGLNAKLAQHREENNAKGDKLSGRENKNSFEGGDG